MKALRAGFFQWLAQGWRSYFALGLTSMAALLVISVSCSKAPEPERKVKMYQSPMHPWITSQKPGNCTICGMALVPVYEGESGMEVDPGIIALNPRSVDVLAVTTVPVRRLGLTRSLPFSGILEDDENIHRIIAAFYDGRIDEIYLQHVGQYVEKGQPLAAIYSPELLYVVREYQNATRSGDPAVARNSAQRLVQYGLSAEQVAALAKQPENVYTINLLAPISGTVLTKKAFKGQYIKTGEPLFEMGNLARLWFHAEVYERDLPDIRIGQKAILTTPTVPGREFEGIVTFIDPNFDSRTRSTKVRIEVDNPPVSGEQHGLQRVLPHRRLRGGRDRGELWSGPRHSKVRRAARRQTLRCLCGKISGSVRTAIGQDRESWR
jgi:membrane fusion protein, copper/silver efflux system